MKNTVLDICDAGLCTACGVCAGVCPHQCIELKLQDGQPVPFISVEKCTKCGMCKKVCPQSGFDYKKYNGSANNFWIGSYQKLLTAQNRDEKLLGLAKSGGVVTQLIKDLLEDRAYDSVFTVGTYCHKEVTCAENFDSVDKLRNTPKSRYIMVSHEKTIRYMRENRNSRIIIVATPCVIHGIVNTIELFKLNRDNYLLIGLFCDKTMTNKIFDYFETVFGNGNQKLDKMYFRTKEVGNWPGGIRLFWQNGSFTDLANKERTRVKEYYQPEGCLYCLDKVNYLADIAVGDNYVGEKADIRGTSSIILRSKAAMDIWERYKEQFIYYPESEENILNSQKLALKKDNLAYARYKGVSYNLPESIMSKNKKSYSTKRQYKKMLNKIAYGRHKGYQHVYKKSRHTNKWLLSLFYGMLGKLKKVIIRL